MIKNKTANVENEHGDNGSGTRHLNPLSLQGGVRLDKATNMYMEFHQNTFLSKTLTIMFIKL